MNADPPHLPAPPEADPNGAPNGTSAPAAGFSIKRLIPLGILAVGFALFFVLGFDEYVSFQALRENRMELTGFVDRNGLLAVLLFIGVYTTATALSLPGGAVLTISAGFLFGAWLGTVYVVIGATAGAILVFLIAKTSLGDALRAKAGPAMRKMEAGFRENAISYLLVLRLIPLFPFFIVNIVPAFLGVPLRIYAIATFFGIIPGSFVYASVGAGIGSVFDQMDGEFSPADALTTEVIIALVGLSVLSLLPVAYKKLRARRVTEPAATD